MELLTIDQVSELLKVSKATIYYYVGRAEIPFIKVGKHLRFEAEKVLAHFKKTTEESVANFSPNRLEGLASRSVTIRNSTLAPRKKE